MLKERISERGFNTTEYFSPFRTLYDNVCKYHPYLLRNSLCSVCRINPDLIIIPWKHGLSIAQSLHVDKAVEIKYKDVVDNVVYSKQ